MNPQIAPGRPYSPDASRQVVRGRVEVRARAGETFDDIASQRCVRFGAAHAATRLDGGGLDQTVRRFSTSFLVTRAFSSRARGHHYGHGHEGWDDLERRLGLSRTYRIDVDPDADLLGLIDALRQHPAVEAATPHYLCEAPFTAESAARQRVPGNPRVFEQVGARRALEMEPGDAAVIVAVIDSGVALAHPELDGRIRPGADTVDLVQDLIARFMRYHGRERTRDIADVSDDLGHGTACASIIAARGLRVHPGLGGRAQVLPMRALGRIQKVGRDEATAVGAIPDINAAVKLAVDLGAKVLNLSFGTCEEALRKDDPLPHAAVIEYALERGAIPVAATGNRGDHVRYFPACLRGVIAVGSVDARNRPSRFSSRGRHVALCAPGERIPCATVDGYQENTGTSFAAPFVAAAAALLVAHSHRGVSPLDASKLREVLMHSAKPFSRDSDTHGCGAGVLDVPAALRLMAESNRGPPELRLLPNWPGRASESATPLAQPSEAIANPSLEHLHVNP